MEALIRRVLLLLVTAVAASATPWVDGFQGEARDRRGHIVYYEKYSVTYESDKPREVTIDYIDIAGLPIARLESSANHHPFLPNYDFEHFERRHREGLRSDEHTVKLYSQTADGEKKTAEFPKKDNAVSGPGVHYFVQSHLPLLAKGQKIPVEVILPGRLSAYSFDLQAYAVPSHREIFAELRPTALFYRMVIGSIRMIYDRKSRRIVEYFGISNVKRTFVRPDIVRIRYSYPNAWDPK